MNLSNDLAIHLILRCSKSNMHILTIDHQLDKHYNLLTTKDQKDNLFSLVKSLTKSEKRQFKLYVGRLGVNSDSKFLNLFNLLDKAKSTYNEVQS